MCPFVLDADTFLQQVMLTTTLVIIISLKTCCNKISVVTKNDKKKFQKFRELVHL